MLPGVINALVFSGLKVSINLYFSNENGGRYFLMKGFPDKRKAVIV
jgi:hypothetical protein